MAKGLTENGESSRKVDKEADKAPSDSSVPENASRAFEILLEYAGDFNSYQWILTFITGFSAIFTAFHNLGAVFLAATPNHWCELNYLSKLNLTTQKSLLNQTVPWVTGRKGRKELSSCEYYEQDFSKLEKDAYYTSNLTFEDLSTVVYFSNHSTKVCDSWVYDNTTFTSTAVTEWDLVCDHKWMKSSIQSSFMVGILIGAFVFSAISDKLGRRLALLICSVLFVVSSMASVFAKSFILFLILRFITAASGQGLTLCSYILLMEGVSLKGRNIMANLSHIFFPVGFLLLVTLSFLIRDWRLLQLAISLPCFSLATYYWILPESARWLFMQGREEEALQSLKAISDRNDKTLPPTEKLKPYLEVIREEVEKRPKLNLTEQIKSILDLTMTLLRTPNMRRRSLIMFYSWFVTSMIYYGLAFSGARIDASLHTSSALLSIADCLSVPSVIVLLLYFGRRTVLCGSYFVTGFCCIITSFLPHDAVGTILTFSMVGKLTNAMTFGLVFMLSAEMVPTFVRNISIGMSSVWARVGSAIAPFISDLLGDVYFPLPLIVFGSLSLIAGFLAFMLPETGNKRLPESIEEVESMER